MKNIVIVLIMLFLVSCKTTRETVNRTETKQEKTATEVQQTTQVQTNEKANTVEQIAEAENAVITETETYLSKPDSAGQQHPEKIIERKIETGKKREQGKTTSTETVIKVVKDETQKAETKTVTESTEKVKTKEKQRWPWQITITIVAAAVVALFVFRNRLKWIFK